MDELSWLHTQLLEWELKKVCTSKELESLIDLLIHACKSGLGGSPLPLPNDRHPSLRTLCTTFISSHLPQPGLQVGFGMVASIFPEMEWHALPTPHIQIPQVVVTSNTLGSWGCCAMRQQSWSLVAWDDSNKEEPMPIILACAAWDLTWHARVTTRW